MKSATLGSDISITEVSHIDTRGFWLYVDGREHYLPFEDFPWFEEATVKQLSHVERVGTEHVHWPDLDIDLTRNMIDYPEKYPLKYR